MKQIQRGDLSLWQFERLANDPLIRHFVTDRNSNANGKPFTLSYSSTPDKEEVRKNRSLLAAAMAIPDSKLFLPSQVHLTRIVHVSSLTSKEELMDTDALLTTESGIGIAVMSADCVPILLIDRKNKVAGAVHSGWRGTVARILEKTLNEMQKSYGTKGEDIRAGIGPSASQQSYEVGSEVIEAVNKSFGTVNDLLIPTSADKAKLDLWKANRQQLVEFGVDPSHIETSNLCTVINNANFFSARRGDTGRFAAGIVLA